MELLLNVFLAMSALLWGIASVIWRRDTAVNLCLKLVSVMMLVSSLLLLLGVLGFVVVI
jgi:hypothetical protein